MYYRKAMTWVTARAEWSQSAAADALSMVTGKFGLVAAQFSGVMEIG
jgi:thiamine pyrophosphate-dependent acetolactate synthase large subunit-like protein